MAGWFYQPPPQPTQIPPPWLPQGTAVQGPGVANPTRVAGTWAALRASWPEPAWSAQAAAPAAALLAFPQGGLVFVPKINPALQKVIRDAWPDPLWSAQSAPPPAGYLAGIFVGPIYQSVAPIQWQIRNAWGEPDWKAQTGAQIAAQFALAVTTPLTPYPPAQVFNSIRALWPDPSWLTQSEGGLASGVAVPVPPPPLSSSQAKNVYQWVPQDWSAQHAAPGAAMLPPPIASFPIPITQWQIWSYPRESWSAQEGADVASTLAVASNAIPFISMSIVMGIRNQWPQEQWNAQAGAIIGAQTQVFNAPAYANRSLQYSVRMQWQEPQWAAQTQAPVGALVGTPTPHYPGGSPTPWQIWNLWQPPWTAAQIQAPAGGLVANPFIPPPITTVTLPNFVGMRVSNALLLAATLPVQLMEFVDPYYMFARDGLIINQIPPESVAVPFNSVVVVEVAIKLKDVGPDSFSTPNTVIGPTN